MMWLVVGFDIVLVDFVGVEYGVVIVVDVDECGFYVW